MNDMGPRQITIIIIILLFGALIPIMEFPTSSGDLINPSAIQNHGNITIDGNSQFISANGVLSGAGTKNNPYIIENWSIDATSNTGIYITGTNSHFIIRNCYIFNGTNSSSNSRIYFFNVTNGKIINNKMEKNYNGIYVRYSNNITIANNTCNFNDQNGIDFHKEIITIINNTSNSNGFCGIQSYQENNNLIFNNNCSHNNKGIESGINSDSNIIANNTCISNDFGIYLFQSTKITITNNSLYSCSIFLLLGTVEYWNTHTIDSTNLVNNKPVCYLTNVNNTIVPPNVGQIILANCSEITIENPTLDNISSSIILGYSNNNIIFDLETKKETNCSRY